MCCRNTACLNPKITVHARCRHTHLWQWVAWMVRPKWLHRPHNPLREGHLSRVGVEGLFLLDASWQTACLRHFALEYCISTNLYYICENTFRMSNKYWRILLLISVLLVTRPAAAQGTVSLAPSTTIPVLSTYIYLADGTKYKIIDAAGNGRSYIGPFCLAIEKSGSGSRSESNNIKSRNRKC